MPILFVKLVQIQQFQYLSLINSIIEFYFQNLLICSGLSIKDYCELKKMIENVFGIDHLVLISCTFASTKPDDEYILRPFARITNHILIVYQIKQKKDMWNQMLKCNYCSIKQLNNTMQNLKKLLETKLVYTIAINVIKKHTFQSSQIKLQWYKRK
ncbi:unnamed protein product [Paramecium pentaurelia]|uniref:Uncharacterized protein n=1 Tax=Paramecium pentaurelia TaxID=43138 RepID=A0A8S1UKV9_9CILI|nr:unnamed protein product [Paramecium pentaurelia]